MTPTEELQMAFRIRVAALAVASLTLAFFTWSAIVGTEGAAAARYVVAQCGWHVGQDADWADNSADRYMRSSYCQTPDSADPFDGVHLTSEAKGAVRAIGGTRYARWRWQAPAGTGIVVVHGQRWQFLRDGFQHRLGGVAPSGGFSPFLSLAESDAGKRDFSSSFSPFAQAFESRLLCAKPDDRQCDADGKVLAGVRVLTITLDDPARPTAQVGGALTTAGWLRGTQSVSFSDHDVGAGLQFGETSIDGRTLGRAEANCSKVQIAGQWRGRKMQPCPLSFAGSHSVDTRTLTDGPHQLRHCAIDFATNQGCAADRAFRVDNNPPASPRGLAVEGGDDWRRLNSFDLTWSDPSQGAGSPIAASWLRLGGPAGPVAGPRSRAGSGRFPGITVPGPGEYRAKVWLADEAGNTDESHSAEATLRFDDVPPTAYFEEPPADDPTLIRVPVADAHSGVVGGSISWRALDGDRWHEMPLQGSEGERTELVGRFPVDQPPGTWILKATVTDRAGNVTVTDRRANGSQMTVRTPVRGETTILAGLSKGSGPARASVRVEMGERALLTGRLLADGSHAQSDQTVVVEETPYRGSRGKSVSRTARTDARGGFEMWLEAGPGRRVKVSFAGTRRLEGSISAPLEMRVLGRVSLAARPRSLVTGQRVRFSGRVAAPGAWHPRRGNLVQIQYFEESARRWRPVVLSRTDRGGRFRCGYRFRYITGVARIRLRARLIPVPAFPYLGVASRPVTVRVRG